jgi:hypothetical protein
MMNRLRALWRKLFHPEPPARLDGMIIQFRTIMTCSGRREKWSTKEWDRQLAIRGAENRARNEAWKRGERVY